MTAEQYLEKVYAGFLGMNVGIRLGAPVEPAFWDYDRILRFYGDIRGYVKDYKHFAADDDANGPVFFLRCLDDMTHDGDPTPADVAEAWLNYAREGVGLYWWGGFGISTEHTAYLNLKHGIQAPQSGSIAQNGLTLAEQIGGQIFIDTWGLIAPCDPARAARYARIAASVSHDGEGLHGAAFMAAAIAKAFETSDIAAIVHAGLAEIPKDCKYRSVFDAVEAFYHGSPDDWRACRMMLERDFGYDKYPGVCHIIPNAGVCALSLWYGAGDFARTVEIATMCSWDTDCNAGNVGTILGVATGLAGIPPHYRAPMNDRIVLSGISGYLNILDIPSYCVKLAAIGYRLSGQAIPEGLGIPKEGEIRYDFALPGTTHGFCVSDRIRCSLRHCADKGHSGMGCLCLLMDRVVRGQGTKLYCKTFYRRQDFDDERYMPVFSPMAYPGQKVSFWVSLERMTGEMTCLTPYVKESFSGRDVLLPPVMLCGNAEAWQEISFTIPDLDGGLCEEIGVLVESASPPKTPDCGCLYLDDFTVSGKAQYTLDLTKSRREFGSVLPFSHNHGAWSLEDGGMVAMAIDHAEAVTGNYFMEDVTVTGTVRPFAGTSHLIAARVQGARRGYYGGLHGAGQLAILKHSDGMLKVLATVPFLWEPNADYTLSFSCIGDRLTLAVNGVPGLEAHDADFLYGMAGYAQYAMGRCWFGGLTIVEHESIREE